MSRSTLSKAEKATTKPSRQGMVLPSSQTCIDNGRTVSWSPDPRLDVVTLATEQAPRKGPPSDAPPATEQDDSKPTAPRFIDRLTSEQRKEFPMATGVLDYAPDAVAAVSHISWLGNNKHNPGEPLHHARGKSMDHPDCLVRHLSTRHDPDPAYADDILAPVFHQAEATWRSLMLLQEMMEKAFDLGLPAGARE